MSFFNDYRTVKGNSIRRELVQSLLLPMVLIMWTFFSIEISNLILSNSAIGVALCIGFLTTLDRTIKNKKIKDINFDVFKNFYFTEYIITFLYLVLFGLSILSIVLIKKTSVDMTVLQIVFMIEVELLMFAIAPFIGILCGTKALFPVEIVAYITISVALNLCKTPGILIILIFAVLIPVLLFSSNYIFLEEMKKLIDFNKTSKDSDSNNMHPLIRDYKIYTGSNYSKLLIIYGIMLVLLLITTGVFIHLDGFGSANITIQNAVFISTIAGFAAAHCNPAELYKKKNCYFLSVKNTFKIYKNYYLLSYGTLLAALLLFVILSFVYAGAKHSVPENFVLRLLIDIEGLLLIFAVIPFFFTSKSSGVMVIKVMLLAVATVPLKIFLNKSWGGIPGAIVLAIGLPVVMYFSNKYWLKTAEEKYLEM